MPEHIRALIIILGAALPVFWLAREPIAAVIDSDAAYKRDRNLWLAITFIAFLSHNFWIYACLSAVVLLKQRKQHDNVVALYCVLLFAVSGQGMTIPGIGPIDHIIFLNHYRLLNLTILLPTAWHLYKTRAERPPTPVAIDLLFGCYLLWAFIVQGAEGDVVGTLRAGFYSFLDSWLPYYVASRYVTAIGDFRRIAAALVVACTIVAILAVFESLRHWLLYDALRSALGISRGRFGTYLARGSGGPLRATVSLGHAIVLGYALTVGVAMAVFLYPKIRPIWKAKTTIACLASGLIATVSRGPWVGCAAMLLVVFALGPGLGKRVMYGIFVGGATILVLVLSPLGDTVLAYLPFVGTKESGTIDYRARLFEVSMIVFRQNPYLGDFNYLQNPLMEQMRQGQQIIDMVNTYLQIALPYGAIGLALFIGGPLLALRGVNKARKRFLNEPDVERLGRTLLGVQIGMLVIIATVSSIGIIPTLLWFFTGICVGYMRVFAPTTVRARVRSASSTRSTRSAR